MSRYDWPGGFSYGEDSLLSRNAFNFLNVFFASPEFLALQIAAHSAYLAALSATDAELWLPIGPSTMFRSTDPARAISGRVKDIRVSEDGQRAYAAAANGGVWYTSDGAQNWQPLGSWGLYAGVSGGHGDVQSLTIGALDVHFGKNSDGSDNPDLDVVYAATGEAPVLHSATPGGNLGGIGVQRLDGALSGVLASAGANPWKREAVNLTGAGIYRLTHNPAHALSFDPGGSNTLVAATTYGLYSRSGGFAENADWTRKSGNFPFDFSADSGVECTDVLWQPALGGRNARLWVAIKDGSGPRTNVYVSEHGLNGPFDKIKLPGHKPGARLGLAAATSGVIYVLGQKEDNSARLWRINTDKSVHVVAHMPMAVFDTPETDKDTDTLSVGEGQAWYDLAIAVDPANENTVYVGGSGISVSSGWTALIYKLAISMPSAGNYQTDFNPDNQANPTHDSTFIGNGIHADIHSLRINNNALWVGCDGGIFHRPSGLPAASRNAGLAVLEPGYVAVHPTSDGACLAGTQDNGQIRRVGDTLWERWHGGDGGGVAYHPHDPDYYVGQYINAKWSVNGGKFQPPVYRSTLPSGASDDDRKSETVSQDRENARANFYSNAAVISGEKLTSAGAPDPATQGNARLAVGTNRVWYCENWKPTPSTGDTTKWVTLPTGTDARKPPRNDRQDILPNDNIKALKWAAEGDPKTFAGARLLILSGKTILQYTKGTAAAWTKKDFNAGTGGSSSKKQGIRTNDAIPDGPSDSLPRVGLWTDIAPHENTRGPYGSFYVSCTGKAEVSADGTIVEADKMDTLWWFDGTDKFHPTGLRNTPLDARTGTSGSKAPAYAVLVDPDHSEIVYVGNALGVWKGTLSFAAGKPQWQWRGSLNGLPQAVVQDLSFYRKGDLRLLRAALQSRGVWEVDLSAVPKSVGRTYLRLHDLDTRRDPSSLSGSHTGSDASPDVFALPVADPLPWGSGMPTEADLFSAINDGLLPLFGDAPGQFRVFVMLHHRHTRALPGNEARVLLLRLDDAPADLSTVSLGASWAQAVMDIFNGGHTAPTGWKIADADNTKAVRSPARPLDARTPGAVRFTVDLTHAISDPAVGGRVLLLAIVTSTTDAVDAAALTQPDLEKLLRLSGHAGARRVELESPGS